jgi:hypothetical protein
MTQQETPLWLGGSASQKQGPSGGSVGNKALTLKSAKPTTARFWTSRLTLGQGPAGQLKNNQETETGDQQPLGVGVQGALWAQPGHLDTVLKMARLIPENTNR